MTHNEEENMAACIRRMLKRYFKDLDGEKPGQLYEMMLSHVEKPMLEFVLNQAGHNQSRAAEWLGINRNTLRKKLQQYGLE
jgi:Fis family transcriptional regulator